jgi:hypothetical protein
VQRGLVDAIDAVVGHVAVWTPWPLVFWLWMGAVGVAMDAVWVGDYYSCCSGKCGGSGLAVDAVAAVVRALVGSSGWAVVSTSQHRSHVETGGIILCGACLFILPKPESRVTTLPAFLLV